MTPQQHIFVDAAIKSIQEARTRLDLAMFKDTSHPMTDEEYNKVHKAYEHLCKANDLL